MPVGALQLCPSERYSNSTTCRKRHKNLTDWARQMILQIRRWLPRRKLVVVGDSVVGDSSFSVIDLLAQCQAIQCPAVTMVTRLRLDAALYEPAPPRQPGTLGRPRKKGERLPRLKANASLDSKNAWRIPTPSGNGWKPPGGTATPTKKSRSLPAPAFGTIRANRSSRFGGSWSATRKGTLIRRHSCLRIRKHVLSTSCAGLCGAGRWRSPSRRCVDIWAWKRKDSGRILRSCARLPVCWASSP